MILIEKKKKIAPWYLKFFFQNFLSFHFDPRNRVGVYVRVCLFVCFRFPNKMPALHHHFLLVTSSPVSSKRRWEKKCHFTNPFADCKQTRYPPPPS